MLEIKLGEKRFMVSNGSENAIEALLRHLSESLRLLDETQLSPHAAALIDHAANLVGDAIEAGLHGSEPPAASLK